MTVSDTDALLYAFRENVVVAASAGTGKTHRLTALYTLLTLGLTSMGKPRAHEAHDPVEPTRIVATTFSRAAAREIRGRIEQALEPLAENAEAALHPGQHRFYDVISERARALGIDLSRGTDRRMVGTRARAAFDGLPFASIDTLHGLAGRLVRDHAIELGIPPGLSVLEEDEAAELTDQAVDETLSEALSAGDAETADAARSLVTACGGTAWTRQALRRWLDRLDEEGVGVFDLQPADHVAEASVLRQRIARVCNNLVVGESDDAWRSLARPLLAELDASEVDVTTSLASLLAKRLPSQGKRTTALDDLAELIATLPGTSKGEKAERAGQFLALAPQLAATEQRVLELVGQVQRRAFGLKRSRLGLGFGDVLRLAHRGLRDHPALARRAADTLDVLMVDEFQDTSRVQRDLVYLLRHRGERNPGQPAPPNELARSGLFVVGDRKQSIYGFRGADVGVFAQVCGELAGAAAGEALGLPKELWATEPVASFVALTESRRSGSRIVSFVNAYCELDFANATPSPARAFDMRYESSEHLIAINDTSDDAVTVIEDAAPGDDAPSWSDDIGSAGREALVAAAAARTIDCAYRDVAILARRRATIPMLEWALDRVGVPYVVAGRALFDALEVRDLAALLRLVVDPRDQHALAAVLRGPAVALSDVTLARLCVPKRGLSMEHARHAQLDDHAEAAALTRFLERFPTLRAAMLRLAPGDALRVAIEELDLDAIWAGLPRATARIGNVDRLVGIARARGGPVPSFSRWLDRQVADDADEPEAVVFSPEDDAVRLTTIHGSKGLDFDTVILVDLASAPAGSAPPLALFREPDAIRFVMRHVAENGTRFTPPAYRASLADLRARDLAERRRLTYVALTRAKRQLILIDPADGARARPTGKPGSAQETLRIGLSEGATLRTHITHHRTATDVLRACDADMQATAAQTSESAAPSVGPQPTEQAARISDVALATTPLGLFRGCPRRFQLRYLHALDEPVETGQLDLFDAPSSAVLDDHVGPVGDEELDPREAGRALHRVLEQWPLDQWGRRPTDADVKTALARVELPPGAQLIASPVEVVQRFLGGDYARHVSKSSRTVLREWNFVVRLAAPNTPTVLSLRGAVDLIVQYDDGSADLIDYKLSRPKSDLSRYAFQLSTYALAVRQRLAPSSIRAGVLFLGEAEPRWLPDGLTADDELDGQHDELVCLANELARSRETNIFAARPLATCRALGCGFVTACHRRKPKRSNR